MGGASPGVLTVTTRSWARVRGAHLVHKFARTAETGRERLRTVHAGQRGCEGHLPVPPSALHYFYDI